MLTRAVLISIRRTGLLRLVSRVIALFAIQMTVMYIIAVWYCSNTIGPGGTTSSYVDTTINVRYIFAQRTGSTYHQMDIPLGAPVEEIVNRNRKAAVGPSRPATPQRDLPEWVKSRAADYSHIGYRVYSAASFGWPTQWIGVDRVVRRFPDDRMTIGKKQLSKYVTLPYAARGFCTLITILGSLLTSFVFVFVWRISMVYIRMSANQCITCGYQISELRRCPECGDTPCGVQKLHPAQNASTSTGSVTPPT